jgi:uncharacterized protein
VGVDPTFEGTGRPGPPRRPVIARRRRGALLPTLVILAVIVAVILIGAQFWTDLLWYQSVGYTRVFTTQLFAKVLLFVVGGLLAGGAVFSSLIFAFRSRPVYAPVSPEQASLDRYREQVEPLRKLGTIAVPIVVGLLSGGAAAGQWKTYLLWRHAQPFHIKDPQFHLDVGFFVFTLPWLRFVAGFLMTVVIVAGIAAAATHYLYGGLRVQGGSGRTTTAARVHLSVILGVLVLLRAGNYWLERYELATKNSTLITGLTYADAHALLPAKAILAAASVICAALFFATIWTGSWRLPGVGVVLLLVCAIVIGLIYPALVQSLKVRPSAQTLERPYITRNIAATRSAYDLTGVQSTAYNAQTTATTGQLRNDAETIPGIRLLDPSRVSDTFRQLEQIRQYYAFPDSLDVDRYTINGKSADTVIAVRELNLSGISNAQRTWLNDHTIYTHGFGVVAAYGNQRTSDGRPVFFEGDIPPTGALSITQPRVYYGEESPDFSIVGAPAGTAPRELDYPDSSASGQQDTTYTGNGGVKIGSFFKRLAYALKYKDENFLLSNAINKDSQILYDREPRERIEKVAPWLTLDGDPYPAVVDGHIEWIVDGYTTTDDYPYSRLTTLNSATQDSLTATTNSVVALGQQDVNYIRNSVKATVDAYTGKVTLYAWDQGDPMLKAWEGAFPGSVKPLSDISGDLMAHLRYPEDLFKVQRDMLAKYHVTDPASFYGGQDFWTIPPDPTQTDGSTQPPYYLTLKMPTQTSASFSLTSTYIPAGSGTRSVLTAFLAVDADAGSTTGAVNPGYGTIRMLELPKDTAISGPGQVQNQFNSNPTAQNQLRLLNQNGSKVESGNLLTLPVGGGLLYVQPVFVRGTGETSYPLLQDVFVAFGDQIGFAPTLDAALDQVFGGNSGANAGDAAQNTGGATTAPGGGTGTTTQTAQQQLAAALQEASAAIKASSAALAKNDFAAYGVAQKELADAVKKAIAAQAEIAATPPAKGSTATPTSGATATATPSATPTG